MKALGIFGASGLAREVADIAGELGYTNIVFIDCSDMKIDTTSGLSIIHEDEINNLNDSFDYIIGIGDGKIRAKVFNKFPYLNYVNLIHPLAYISIRQRQCIKKMKGNIFFPGSCLTNNIKVGNFGIYYLNVTVAHDCIIENFVTISPGASISGNVKISEYGFIGTGATILQGDSLQNKLVIGEYAIVGAGSVVTKSVSPFKIVKGVPAR